MAEVASVPESPCSRTATRPRGHNEAESPIPGPGSANTDPLDPCESMSNFSFDNELVQTGVYQRFDQEMANAALPEYQSELGAAINLGANVSLANIPMPITTVEISEPGFYEDKGTLRRSQGSSPTPGQHRTRWKKIVGRNKTTSEPVSDQRPSAIAYMNDPSHYIPAIRRRAVSRPEGAVRLA